MSETDRTDAMEYERILEEERLILDATETIYRLMEERSVSKADLARLIGRTRGHVTQLLEGGRNMTLRTLADLGYVLGHRIRVDVHPLARELSMPTRIEPRELATHTRRRSSRWAPAAQHGRRAASHLAVVSGRDPELAA
jgi:transcriptional regulator with XRE-family HTH domain